MGAFSTPLSGLTAASKQLQSVSNNLANIDTDGYKDQTLTFSDVYAQTGVRNGAGDPVQTGSGVSVAATDSDFTEGTLSSTSVSSNMAISGNGFFVVQDGSQVAYTRTGDFTTNSAGEITSASGGKVLGYPAVNGAVMSGSTLQPLQVGTAPAASTTIDISGKLNSGTATVAGTGTSTIAVYDSLGNKYNGTVTFTETAPGSNTWKYTTAVSGATVTGGTGTVTFSSTGAMSATTSVPMTLTGLAAGATSPQTVDCSFGTVSSPTITQLAQSAATATADGSATTTSAAITISGSLDAGTSTVAGSGTSSISVYDSKGTAYAGTVTFTETAPGSNTWNYATAVTGATVAGGTGTLTFDSTGALTSTTNVAPLSLTGLTAGATSPQTVTVSTSAMTQTPASTTTATTDGALAEKVSTYAVATDGTITGTFANGNTTVLGQVAVANFANVQGLVDIGGNNYQATKSSGVATTGVPGTNGAGTVLGGEVEGSNVDIAKEFAKLIVAQQAYSANAKSITTLNSVSQATLAMIQ